MAESIVVYGQERIVRNGLPEIPNDMLPKELENPKVRWLLEKVLGPYPELIHHSQHVAFKCYLLGIRLGLSKEELDTLYNSALLHDIGKANPDIYRLINLPRKLKRDERSIVNCHPVIGYNIAIEQGLDRYAPGIRWHHEYFAGGGYPDGLSKDSIPLTARIIGFVDWFVAMTEDRPDNKGAPVIFAIAKKKHQLLGERFDPRLFDPFIQLMIDVRWDSELLKLFQSSE